MYHQSPGHRRKTQEITSHGPPRDDGSGVGETHVTTGNLETSHDSLPLFEVRDTLAKTLHNATELVAEDITLLHLHDAAVQQMQVATAYGAASDL